MSFDMNTLIMRPIVQDSVLDSEYVKWVCAVNDIFYMKSNTAFAAPAGQRLFSNLPKQAVSSVEADSTVFSRLIKKYTEAADMDSVEDFEKGLTTQGFVMVDIDTESVMKDHDNEGLEKWLAKHPTRIEEIPYTKMCIRIRDNIHLITYDENERKCTFFEAACINNRVMPLFSGCTHLDANSAEQYAIDYDISESLSFMTPKKIGFNKDEMKKWKSLKELATTYQENFIQKWADLTNSFENSKVDCDLSAMIVGLMVEAGSLIGFLNYHTMKNQRRRSSEKVQSALSIPIKVYADMGAEVRERIINTHITIREYGECRPRSGVMAACYTIPEWETRGHWRHYKNGKAVFIKPHICHRKNLDEGSKGSVHIKVK